MILIKKLLCGTFLAVQWLRPRAFTAGGMGLIPGRGTKIPHAVQWQKKKSYSVLHSVPKLALRT